MKSIAALLAASCLAGPMTPDALGFENKAAQHAMEQQRKAMEHEVKRQQELEKKMMEQQKRAMQEQWKAEQKFLEQQRKAFGQQQKAIHEQQKMAPHPTAAPHQAAHPSAAHPSAAHHAPPHLVYYSSRHYYGHSHHRASPYRHYRQMPAQLDPETLALHQLKRSLDAVKPGPTATPAEKTAIKSALIRVVEVPRIPTLTSVASLSGHLADALAHRESAAAQTGPMALTLRAVMNSTDIPKLDLNQIMIEHKAALKTSKAKPAEVAAVMDSLQSISNQERARR